MCSCHGSPVMDYPIHREVHVATENEISYIWSVVQVHSYPFHVIGIMSLGNNPVMD